MHRLVTLLGLLVAGIAHAVPLAPAPSPLVTVTEYYNTALGHYFMTAEAAEAANIDAGGVGPHWARTGYVFSAYGSPGPGRVAVCRFFGRQPGGPNSHFYTANPVECETVKRRPEWVYEGVAFYATPFDPAVGCPGGTYRVYRAYNNAVGGDPNHRYTNRPPVFEQMGIAGWFPEGEVMCTPTPPFTIDEMVSACPTAADVDFVRSVLSINVVTDVSAPTLACTAGTGSRNLTRVEERLYQALKAMRLIRFTSPLPWTTQPTLFDWMINEAGIRGISIDASGVSYCCDAGPALHLSFPAGSVVLATNRWVDLSQGFGLASLVDLITHESRHNQDKPHTCASVPGNDQTLGELGAWAAVYYDYAWLASAADPAFVDQAPAGTTNSIYPDYHSYYLGRATATLSRICNPGV